MDNQEEFYYSLIDELLSLEKITQKNINSLKITLAKQFKFKSVVKNPQILGYARNDEERERLIEIFNTKPIRELSGVTVVALFAKPHSCPHGKCMYCPGGIGSPFGDTPQSYTGQEPAALRARRNMYDPYLQIFNRLEHYVANGHNPDKLELIFMGGTFPSLDQEYRDDFVKCVYKAINDFGELFFTIDDKGRRVITYDVFNDFFEMKTDFSSQKRQISVQEKMLLSKLLTPQHTLTVLRPDAVQHREEFERELKKRGFRIVKVSRLESFEEHFRGIYTEFPKQVIDNYFKRYKENWGDKGIVYLLYKNCENAINDFKENHQGHFLEYQNEIETNSINKSLRGLFGNDSSFNLEEEGFTMTYPGIHCVKDKIELIDHIIRFNVKDIDFKQTVSSINELDYEITKNETSIIRAIGLTVETKPDWALQSHCADMLRYGCTRLEIGVQTLNEDCLKKTNRGHTLQDTKECFQVAKDMCFKINAHMMLGLPASNLESDEKGLVGLFEEEEYRPDMLKIYPCLVVEGTPLYQMYKMGKFEPITTEKAAKIIARAYSTFPRYVRVMRVQRDIPTTLVEGGVQKSNLRQYVEEEMKKNNVRSKDIRAREIGLRQLEEQNAQYFNMRLYDEPFCAIENDSKLIEFRLNDEKRKKISIGDYITFRHFDDEHKKVTVKVKNVIKANWFKELFQKLGEEDYEKMYEIYSREDEEKYGVLGIEFEKVEKLEHFAIHIEEFNASGGKEFFIDVVNSEDTMIGFIRLRFPYETTLMPEIDGSTALIRELHIYGQTIPVGSQSEAAQHKGWGRALVQKCEEISKKNGYSKIAIISGVGVREYYKKLGYVREGPYMVKIF